MGKADEKDTEIIEQLSEVKDEILEAKGEMLEIKDEMLEAKGEMLEIKDEMLVVNQDSQSKIKIILNELEEIKKWKKQQEEEDNKTDIKEHDVYENNETTDESDNDVEIYDDNEEDIDEIDTEDDDEINEDSADNKKLAWYKYSEKFIPNKYKSTYEHDKRKLIEEWYKVCIKINLLPEEFMIEPIIQNTRIKSKSFHKQRKEEWKQQQKRERSKEKLKKK